jgi:DNA-binding IclR family transcriptional regulator
MGRMLLAFMPEVEVTALYAGKSLERFSERTATTLRALLDQAARDRSAGIAWSDGHFERGISSAAVPVFDFAASPAAAINVSGPTGAFAEDAQRVLIGRELRRAGMEISRRLGFVGPDLCAQHARKILAQAGE